MTPAEEAKIIADIRLRVAGAHAARRLRKLCLDQRELARLLNCKQPEISRVMRTHPRASRRVMRDAVSLDENRPPIWPRPVSRSTL